MDEPRLEKAPYEYNITKEFYINDTICSGYKTIENTIITEKAPFKLAPLPYTYKELDPYISERTVSYHYGKHHQTYIDKLNKLISESQNPNLANMTLLEIIRSQAPLENERPSEIFNNAAQAHNHYIYWPSMIKDGGKKTIDENGPLLRAIIEKWGSFDIMIEELKAASMAQFGSGWVWLVADQNKNLKIIKTDNASTPIIDMNLTPLINIDIWEHSYYLDHQNNRKQYCDAFFDHLVNWNFAEYNFNNIQ